MIKIFLLFFEIIFHSNIRARKADINKNLTSHVERHTFEYLYMTTVGNLYGLKEILGHSKIETTERYAHLDDEYQLE